jgi:hypothetical protein
MIPRQPSGPCPSGPAPPWSRPPAATPSTSPSRPRWLRSSSSRPPSSKRNRGPAAWAGRISRRPKLLRVGDPDLGRSCHLACSTAQARATKAAIRPAPTTSSTRRPPGWPPRAAPSWSSSPAPTWPTSPNPQPWPMPCAPCCDSAAEPRHPIKHQPARAGSRPPITATSKGAQSRAKVGNTFLASLAAKLSFRGPIEPPDPCAGDRTGSPVQTSGARAPAKCRVGRCGWSDRVDVRQARDSGTMRFSSPHDLTDTRACRRIVSRPRRRHRL